MTQIAKSDFPDSTWDGLCYQYDSTLTDSDPNFFWQDRATVEIQAVEDYLFSFSDLFDFFGTLGAANSVVGVKADQSNLTYKTLVAGSGITIEHTDATTTFTATGGGGGTADALTVNLANAESVNLSKCQVIYPSSAGNVKLAKADAEATIHAIGLATALVAPAATGVMQTDGTLTATTGEWDAVTGDSGGLTTDSIYFLSEATAGALTSVAPTSGYVVPVGIAVSTMKMKINLLVSELL